MSSRYRIQWAPVAERDLDEILEYIAERDCVDAAIQIYTRISERIDGLQRQPERCRIVAELKRIGVSEYRELIVSPYSVFFRIRERTVGIVGIVDRRRDLAELLVQRVLR